MVSDGSYIPAEVSRNSWIDVGAEVEQSFSYLDDLDQELAAQPGFKKSPSHTVTKKITTSTTDPECGYIHHGNKRVDRNQPPHSFNVRNTWTESRLMPR